MSSASASSASVSETAICFEISFGGARHSLAVSGEATVGELKTELEALLGVAAAGQKLIGMPAAPSPSPSGDAAPLAALPLKRPVQKLILMGTTDANLAAAAAARDATSAAAGGGGEDEGEDDEEPAAGARVAASLRLSDYEELIARRSAVAFTPVAGFRPGRWTLVLDIDYTLIDHRSVVSRPLDMARPFLHYFCALAYAHGYDIVIWSATSLSWAQLKMRDMGLTRASAFSFAGYLDGRHMVPVEDAAYGRVLVKPLAVLWRMGLAAPATTVHLDDLRRNFLLNPVQGLRIKACRDLPATRADDRELRNLACYLCLVRRLPSLAALRHRDWKAALRAHGFDAATASDDDAARFVQGLAPIADLPPGGGSGGGGGEGGGGGGGGGAAT